MLALSEIERREREIKTEFLFRMARELDTRKAALTKQVDEINTSLSNLWAEYGSMHNSGVYANRIPTELLCLIFSYCLSTPKLSGDGFYVYEDERPSTEVVLSHVCQHWRSVAISDPALWRTFRYKTPRWKRDPLSRFNTYMKRSYPVPIDLFVHCNFTSHEDMTLLNAAALQVHRWRRVTILSEDNKFNWSQFQYALMDKEAPNLEYFSFRPSLFVSPHTNSGHISPVSILAPKIFRLGAPKLTQIFLDSTAPYFFLPPFCNIQTFSLDAKYIGPSSITWNAFLHILAIPSLANLSIGGEVLLGPLSDQLHERINAPTLKHLRWSGDPACLDHLLSYLSAPRLESLILCRMHLPPKPTHPNAGLSLPSLRHLYIIECVNLSAHYIQFLASGSPNIVHLAMSYYRPEGGHLLNYLNEEFDAGREHWMNLESLTAYIDGTDQVAPYFTFIRPRKREGCSMTLRVSNRLYQAWAEHLPQGYDALGMICKVEPWMSVSDILPAQWPPGGQACVSQHDRSSQFTFAVDWNEF